MAKEIYKVYHESIEPLDTYDNITEAIKRCEMLVDYKTDHRGQLFSELNTMQAEHSIVMEQAGYDVDNTAFQSKYTIPLYFLNLVLSQYRLRIESHLCN